MVKVKKNFYFFHTLLYARTTSEEKFGIKKSRFPQICPRYLPSSVVKQEHPITIILVEYRHLHINFFWSFILSNDLVNLSLVSKFKQYTSYIFFASFLFLPILYTYYGIKSSIFLIYFTNAGKSRTVVCVHGHRMSTSFQYQFVDEKKNLVQVNFLLLYQVLSSSPCGRKNTIFAFTFRLRIFYHFLLGRFFLSTLCIYLIILYHNHNQSQELFLIIGQATVMHGERSDKKSWAVTNPTHCY